jgi:hypothetical protein
MAYGIEAVIVALLAKKSGGKPGKKDSMKRTAVLSLILYFVWLLSTAFLPFYYREMTPEADENDDSFFPVSGEAALGTLTGLLSRGTYSASGREPLTESWTAVRTSIHATALELAAAAPPGILFEVDEQCGSGVSPRPGLYATYSEICNVVVRVTSPAHDPALLNLTVDQNALLIAGHFDSHYTGPGASDDLASVAVMLELLHAIAAAGTPAALPDFPLIFLFDGSEESGLEGSHFFVTQHEWAPTVAFALNLESVGEARRRPMLASTNSPAAWAISALRAAGNTNAASGASLVHDLFQSFGLPPSATDMASFRLTEQMRGAATISWLTGGEVYHSHRDDLSHVSAQGLQAMLNAVTRFIRALRVPAELPSAVNADDAGAGTDVCWMPFVLKLKVKDLGFDVETLLVLSAGQRQLLQVAALVLYLVLAGYVLMWARGGQADRTGTRTLSLPFSALLVKMAVGAGFALLAAASPLALAAVFAVIGPFPYATEQMFGALLFCGLPVLVMLLAPSQPSLSGRESVLGDSARLLSTKSRGTSAQTAPATDKSAADLCRPLLTDAAGTDDVDSVADSTLLDVSAPPGSGPSPSEVQASLAAVAEAEAALDAAADAVRAATTPVRFVWTLETARNIVAFASPAALILLVCTLANSGVGLLFAFPVLFASLGGLLSISAAHLIPAAAAAVAPCKAAKKTNFLGLAVTALKVIRLLVLYLTANATVPTLRVLWTLFAGEGLRSAAPDVMLALTGVLFALTSAPVVMPHMSVFKARIALARSRSAQAQTDARKPKMLKLVRALIIALGIFLIVILTSSPYNSDMTFPVSIGHVQGVDPADPNDSGLYIVTPGAGKTLSQLASALRHGVTSAPVPSSGLLSAAGIMSNPLTAPSAALKITGAGTGAGLAAGALTAPPPGNYAILATQQMDGTDSTAPVILVSVNAADADTGRWRVVVDPRDGCRAVATSLDAQGDISLDGLLTDAQGRVTVTHVGAPDIVVFTVTLSCPAGAATSPNPRVLLDSRSLDRSDAYLHAWAALPEWASLYGKYYSFAPSFRRVWNEVHLA